MDLRGGRGGGTHVPPLGGVAGGARRPLYGGAGGRMSPAYMRLQASWLNGATRISEILFRQWSTRSWCCKSFIFLG